jgi:tetrachlorobenzoquinone reductase
MNTTSPLTLRVQAIRYEAQRVVTVELMDVEGHLLPEYDPGAHIDLHLPNGIVRSYSLLGNPAHRDRYTVGILLDPTSRGGSRYVHQQLRVGTLLKIDGPRNHFTLDEDASNSVLIAGGIGITPIVCMARRLAEQGRQFSVLYCARSRAEAAFVAELSMLGGTVQFHFDDEQNGPPDLNAVLAAQPRDAHFYCCGPDPMLRAFESSCASLGYPHVHVERFAADQCMSAAQDSEYSVTLARSGNELRVTTGTTLLDTLLAAGVDVDYSCREGICGSCETRVLDGIPDHRDSILSRSERESNTTMMICVSGCKSKRLVLDL